MKNFYFTVTTYSLFQLMLDLKHLHNSVGTMDFKLVDRIDRDIHRWLWSIELELLHEHTINIVLSTAFLSDKGVTMNHPAYKDFTENLMKSKSHKFSLKGNDFKENVIAFHEKKYNFEL